MATLVIRQFDVCRNPGATNSGDAPYVCVLQSHYLHAIDTVLVAPLLRHRAEATADQVAVPVRIGEESLLLDAALMTNIDRRSLGRPLASLTGQEDEIRRALDRLFTGF